MAAAGAENVPPFIAAQLTYLLSNFHHTLKIEQMWSSDNYNSSAIDRFTLLIPYCLDFIKWDLIYNVECPTSPPDVVFGPEDEAFHPFHMRPSVEPAQSSNCLADWNYKDPTRLLLLFQFLRDQYVLYQKIRVGELEDERLKFELNTILHREGIEMHMSLGAEKCS
ncbi:hypothetical protein RJT34_14436 [Clitoria ternatea]|uniref:BRISC and BRCA1-A complex member 2 n=1 Tax=Clitoria ternatea TaxID=43366 RepID=A0AAN9PMN9_CLITE